jgi:hypothetical protein
MTTVTIQPNNMIVLDPSDSRIVVFDWDDENLAAGVLISGSATWTITAIRQNGATALTKDNESILSGSRKAQARLIATTATAGDEYEVACKITTNETPAQIKEQSIRVLIQNR